MSSLGSQEWREISPYLDRALALPEGERDVWLRTIKEQQPELAARLEKLLEEHRALEREHFLETPALQPSAWSAPGRTVGVYTLLSPIGAGGMGSVWLAERSDGRFERRVAVKFLNFALAAGEGALRFKREGKILGQLAHPHIAELIDAGVTPDGAPYLVLEYVDGATIDTYCDEHLLDIGARIRIFIDVLRAVAHAHANLIVHRDIKPSNVLVRNDGQVKLLDFGIAKLLADERSAGTEGQLTATGAPALTPQFAAPEQVEAGAITTATDVYALGVLLYILLIGRHPTGTDLKSTAALVKAIVESEPKLASEAVLTAEASAKRGGSPDKLCRELRGDLDTILVKTLKKNPQERYSSVTALREDLERYLRHEPISTRPDSITYRAKKFVRRNRTTVALASLTCVALIAGIVGILIQSRRTRAERDFAFQELSREETLNDLDNFLLNDAAPSGKPFTVDDLLAEANRIAERESLGGTNRVELLISIGGKYMGQDEHGKARPLLEEAYRLSRGLADPSSRSNASCALGWALAEAGEQQRAETLFQEGMSEIPDEPQYTLDRYHCLNAGRLIAIASGFSQTAIARALAEQKLLQNSPFDVETLKAGVLTELAEAYRNAGRFRESISTFQQAGDSMNKLGRGETQSAGTLYNDWALALAESGRPLEADKLYRHAIEISRADNTENAVSPMLLVNYGRNCRELGRLKEAADYTERAYAKGQQAGNEVVVNQALLERGRTYRAQHRLDDATEMLAEVGPRLQRALPPGHYAFAGIASDRSLIYLDRGDLTKALQLSAEALSIDEAAIKAGHQGAGVLPILLLRRSIIELAAKQNQAALVDAQRAADSIRKTVETGTFSSLLGQAYLAKGRALQAQGRSSDAHAAFRSAVENLQSTVGQQHPDYIAAQELADTSFH